MIARDLDESRSMLIRQEDHAELSAQFACHWGNERFSQLDPYGSVVSATAYHDSHFRDIEALLPIDLKEGRPYGHRNAPFSPLHLDALQENIDWLARRDRYASQLVSMHHSGLPQNRYGVINSWQNGDGKAPRSRTLRPEVKAAVEKMEAAQRTNIQELSRSDASIEKQIWFNFRLLEVFDLLSLYLCCDGYGEDGFREVRLGPVPLALGSDEEVTIHIIPKRDGSLCLDPYPFDSRPLTTSVAARIMRKLIGSPEAECRAGFWRAARENLTFVMTD
jgi:hypothetical protein